MGRAARSRRDQRQEPQGSKYLLQKRDRKGPSQAGELGGGRAGRPGEQVGHLPAERDAGLGSQESPPGPARRDLGHQHRFVCFGSRSAGGGVAMGFS